MSLIIENEATPSALYVYAYRLCAAIRALNAVQGLSAEFGAVERLTALLNQIASKLDLPTQTIWIKYDKYLHDQHFQRVEEEVASGWFDSSVLARTKRMDGNA